MKNILCSVMATAYVISSLCALPAQACSFDTQPYFTYTTHPDLPLNGFARGQLGILEPTYARSYLFVAYRYMMNEPLSPGDQKLVVDMWNDRLTTVDASCHSDVSAWLKARAAIPGVAKIEEIDCERPISAEESWQTYCNCQTSAFETAAKTLQELIQRYGANSPTTKEWVKAQDEVFSNCGSRPYSDQVKPAAIPASLPASADAAAQKYRNYQIAAANFYAQNFERAREQFDAIAADKDSPFKQISAYLAARALIRQATLQAKGNQFLDQAQQRLSKLAADPAFNGMKDDITTLSELVDAKLNREHYIHQLLAQTIPMKNLRDVTFVLDSWLDVNNGGDGDDKKPQLPASLLKFDAVDWVVTFQDSKPSATRHAVERWKQTKALPWLVAAVSSIHANDADAPAIMSAAEQHEQAGPARWTCFSNAIRLQLEKHQYDAARKELDTVLANPPADLSPGCLNDLRQQRFALAQNLDEFVKFGIQTPLSICSNGAVEQVPDDVEDIVKKGKSNPPLPAPEFISSAAEAADNQMPLTVLTELAQNQKLPHDQRNNVAWTSWVRAVLIDADADARKLAAIAKPLNKKKAALFDSYLNAADADGRKFAATFLMLQFSSANPNVAWGPLQEDGYGDSSGWWWGEKPVAGKFQLGMGDSDANTVKPVAFDFLKGSAPQVKKELAVLERIPAAPNYFANVVFNFAKTHPADPRVPEALHLVVKATHYGTTTDATKGFSKQAFTMLHTKYKSSPWTAKTPYYY